MRARGRIRNDYPVFDGQALSPRGKVPRSMGTVEWCLLIVGAVCFAIGVFYILSGGMTGSRSGGNRRVKRPFHHGWPEDKKDHESFEENKRENPELLTILVKTMDRPHHLHNLLSSIRSRFPRVPIYVADDSSLPEHSEEICDAFDFVRYYRMPWDTGMNAGWNLLLSQVKSTYFMIIQDDFEFTDKTDVLPMLELLEKDKVDVVGGKVHIAYGGEEPKERKYQYYGLLKMEYIDDVASLNLVSGHARPEMLKVDTHFGSICHYVDFVPPFFVARTSSVRDSLVHGWDSTIKGGGYLDFWLRMKAYGLKVAVCPFIEVVERINDDLEPAHFVAVRARSHRQSPYNKQVMQKHHIDKLVDCVTGGLSESGVENLAQLPNRPNCYVLLDMTHENRKRKS